jgi:hypothetical protein
MFNIRIINRFIIRRMLVLLLLINAGTVHAQLMHIGVLGSSSANGQGVPVDSSWRERLRKYYKETAFIDTLHRVAASTMCCYHGMPTGYVPPPNRPLPNISYNITRVLSRVPKPTHIIVNYPSNGYDTFSTAEVLHCLETIKNTANAEGVECFITSTQPREDPVYFGKYEKRLILKKLRDTIMQHFGPYAIDLWTELADPVTLKRKPQYALANDMLHLSPNGHYAVFNILLEKDILNISNIWNGSVDGSWLNPANWSRGVIPTTSQLVLIKAALHAPAISSNVQVKTLRCMSGSSLSVAPGGRLTISH